MTLFLTSSPTGDLDGSYTCIGLDSRNGFAEQVKRVWKEYARVLMITAFPDDREANREMCAFFYDALQKTGLSCACFELWDSSVLSDPACCTREKLQSYDAILLGGGHVPTQQRFFERLQLREKIAGFPGVIIGISAGSMNCADLVYAQPEEEGEAADPYYSRFLPGLGLTNLNILPHYQLVKDKILDGQHLFYDITIPDSAGHRFLAIPDGSYVIVHEDGREEIFGAHLFLSS